MKSVANTIYETPDAGKIRLLRHIKLVSSPLADHITGQNDRNYEQGTHHSDDSDRSDDTSSIRTINVFKRSHEATTIELFYDLFFVANLATFTANHGVDNSQGRQL